MNPVIPRQPEPSAAALLPHSKPGYIEPMGEMTFDFPPALRRWIEQRLAEGRFADEADYFRDLVRRDQEGLLGEVAEEEPDSPEYIAWVREKIAEGEASGYIERDAREVLKEIIDERRARRG